MFRTCVSGVVSLVLVAAFVSGGCGGSAPLPVSVALSPSSSQAIDVSQAVGITATVVNDRTSQGVVWSLAGPGTLTNPGPVTVTYTSPTTNLIAAQQVSVTATSLTDKTKSASVQITVNPYPQIPYQTLANGSVGTAYSQPIALTGGTPPFQWAVYNGPVASGYKVGGGVPDGLSLDPTTGMISGTPTGGGTWYFEASVTDATGVGVANGGLSVSVNPTGPKGHPVAFLNQPLEPTAVSPGSTGFTLKVSGTGFISGAEIQFDGAPLATTFLDSAHLSAVVPAASITSAGTTSVTVMNPGASSVRSNVVNFQVGSAKAAVSFAAAAGSPMKIVGPLAIVASDFNEDGKPDLAVAANVRVYVLLGGGDGTFAPAANSPIRVVSPPYDGSPSPYTGPMAVGDFNHSGHLGLAVAEFQNDAAAILLGNGDGTFSASSASLSNTAGHEESAIALGDLNGDGNLDLAFTNPGGGLSPAVLGFGDGAFTQAGNLYTTTMPAGIAVGDFNGDGKLDAVVANGGTAAYPHSGLTVSLGNGDGTFTSGPNSPISLGSSLAAIVAADFNGDGKLDVAVTDGTSNTVSILLGNGDGTFGAPTTFSVGVNPFSIIAGDFNNDGKLDLAIANFGDNNITLLLGNGDGTFTPASGSPYPVGMGPYSLTAADFNHDGKLDLAVANLTDGTISILLQQ